MIFAESDQSGDIVECHILCAVFLNILADKDKLCRIFLLFCMCDLWTDTLASIFAPHQNEYLKQAGIDGSTRQDIATEVFFFDFHHQYNKLFMDIGGIVIGNMDN